MAATMIYVGCRARVVMHTYMRVESIEISVTIITALAFALV